MLSFLLDFFLAGGMDGSRQRERQLEKDYRRRAEFKRDKPSIRSQYMTWAREKGLVSVDSADFVHGTVAGREIFFDTGLAGDDEMRPRLDISVALGVSEEILVERNVEPASDVARRVRTLLDKVDLLEKVWLSKDGIRLVFETRVHPDVFDAALDSLDELLHSGPYR